MLGNSQKRISNYTADPSQTLGSAGKSQQRNNSQTSAAALGTNNTTITSYQQPSVPNHIHNNNAERLSAYGERTLQTAVNQAVIKEGPIKVELPVFKPKNECNVIKIIQKEWEREVDRLDQKKMGKR